MQALGLSAKILAAMFALTAARLRSVRVIVVLAVCPARREDSDKAQSQNAYFKETRLCSSIACVCRSVSRVARDIA